MHIIIISEEKLEVYQNNALFFLNNGIDLSSTINEENVPLIFKGFIETDMQPILNLALLNLLLYTKLMLNLFNPEDDGRFLIH